MAATELKLQVGLDLAFFRQQLAQLGNVAVGYQMPINIKFDRLGIQQELNRLEKNINRRKYRLEVATNIQKEIEATGKLDTALNNLQGKEIGIKITGALGKIAPKDATKIRNDLADAVAGGTGKKILVDVSVRENAIGEELRAVRKALNEKITPKNGKILVVTSIRSGITNEEAKEFRESVKRKIGNIIVDVTGSADQLRAKEAKSIRTSLYQSIVSNGGKIKIPATLTIADSEVAAFQKTVNSKFAGITVKVKAEIEEIRGGKAQAQIEKEAMAGWQHIQEMGAARMSGGVSDPARRESLRQSLSGRDIGELRNIGEQLGVKGARRYSNVQNLIEKIVADASIEMVKKYLDPQAVMRNPDRSGLGKVLDTFARGVFHMLGMDPAAMMAAQKQKLLPPSISWPASAATSPSYQGKPGTMLTGAPAPALINGAAGPVGLLPAAYRGIGQSAGPAGLLPAAYRGIAGAPVPRGLGGTAFGTQKYLPTALGNETKKVLRDAAHVFLDTIRQGIREVKIQDFGNAVRTALPQGPQGRSPLMLPPTGGTSAVNRMRISTGAYVGQPPFMQAPSMPPSMAPPLSGQSTKLASPLGAGYFEVGKGLNAIKSAYDQTKTFLNSPKFPVTGAIAGLGGEFGNAVKQVLLFGTAYKALAFLTSLPGEAFEAAKALATYKNQLQAVTTQSQTFDKSLAFVDNLAARFNVPLDSARQGFVKLYASMEPAGFKQGQIENLFTGISKAAAAFGLSSDKVDRVNYAFAQMASKGQIMSEELKGQLGDVLPGALGLFAEAAQMTIPEFSKAMEDGAFKGKAMEQVLDNVSILLNNKFSKAASGASKTLQGAVNQIQNNLKLMYESFTPIVNGAAAAFGPQVNGLIKDVTATMKVLTSTFVGAGNGFNTLSPRAQAFYTAIKTLEPSIRQAGAAIVDLGGRLAQLIPALVQVLAATISFAASPLGRAALLAAVAIGTLTASLAILEATGIKAAIKSVYKFIGTLLAIPAATGAARVAIIGLKLAITGLVVGGILLGLDFLIEKLFKIGDAAQNSTTDLKGLVKQLDEMTATGDLEGLSKQYLDAEKKLAKARNDNAAALVKLRKAQQLPEGVVKTLKVRREQIAADTTLSSVLSAQRALQAAKTARANAIRLKDDADKKTEQESSKLQKIDLSGTDGKKQNLESYYSLQDTLAKDAADFAAAQTEEESRHRIELLERYYDIQETRANAYQKDAIRFEREMVMIEERRQEAKLKAQLDVQRAQSSVAGGAPGSGAGGTGAIFGDTGRTFNAAGFVHGHFQNQDREALVKDTLEVVMGLLSKGVSPKLGSGARFTSGMNANQVEALVRKGIGSHKQYASGAGAIDIFVPKGTRVPASVSGIKNLGGAAGVTGSLPRKSQLMHLDAASTMSASGGEMAPGKVTGDQKRDAVAVQNTLQASIAKTASDRRTDAKAAQEQIAAFEKYRAAAFPTTEQDMQNKLLARRNELFKSGMTDERIDQEIKLYENQERGAAGLAVLDRLLTKKILTDAEYKALTKELNQDIANQNNLLQQNAALIGQSKFDQALKGLRDQVDMARALTPEAEMRTRLQQQGYAGTQLETLFETEKATAKAEQLKTQMQGVASTIGDAFSTAFQGIINGSMSAQDALAGMFQSIGQSFVKMAMDMIAQQITMITLGFIMKALGLIGGIASAGNAAGAAAFSPGNAAGLDAIPGQAFSMPQLSGMSVTGATVGTGFTASIPSLASPGSFGFAKGGAFSSGMRRFATGGIVNGPTLFPFADGGAMQMGLMGEAGPEAIMPLQRGADGALGVRAAMGGNGMGGSSSPILNMNFETSTINGVEYVSRDQLEAAMAQTRRQASSDGAKRGMAMTLDKIQQSPQTRRRIGM